MQLTVGEIIEGKITAVKDYGVFVDLGEGKSVMVHISEIAKTYVNDINEFVKIGDSVKMVVTNISDEGKISLSIKRAIAQTKPVRSERKERNKTAGRSASSTIDSSFVYVPQSHTASSFEEMMNKFKQTSDEKFSDLKRKNPDAKRGRRGGQK